MIYTIYAPKGPLETRAEELLQLTSPGRFDKLVAIPEGLAKWALIAPPFWLAWHRLWWPLVFYFLFVVFCGALVATPFVPISLFLLSLPGLYLLLEGQQLRRNRLEANGLELSGIVDAGSDSAAIAHYLDRQAVKVASNTPSQEIIFRPAIRQSRADGALGLFAEQE